MTRNVWALAIMIGFAIASFVAAPAQAGDFATDFGAVRESGAPVSPVRIASRRSTFEEASRADQGFQALLRRYVERQELGDMLEISKAIFADPHGTSYRERLKILETGLQLLEAQGRESDVRLVTDLIYFLQNQWTTIHLERLLNPSSEQAPYRTGYVMGFLVGFMALSMPVKAGFGVALLGAYHRHIERINSFASQTVRKVVTTAFRKAASPLDYLFQTSSVGRLARMGAYFYLQTDHDRSVALGHLIQNAGGRGAIARPFLAPLSLISVSESDASRVAAAPTSRMDFEDMRDAAIFPTSVIVSIAADRYVKRVFWHALDPHLSALRELHQAGRLTAPHMFLWRWAAGLPRATAAIRSPFSIVGMVAGSTAGLTTTYVLRSESERRYIRALDSAARESLDRLRETIATGGDSRTLFRASYRAFMHVQERVRFSQTPLDNAHEETLERFAMGKICAAYGFPTRRINARYHYDHDAENSYRQLRQSTLMIDNELSSRVNSLASGAMTDVAPLIPLLHELGSLLEKVATEGPLARDAHAQSAVQTLVSMNSFLASNIDQIVIPNYTDPRQYRNTSFTIERVEDAYGAILRARERGVMPAERLLREGTPGSPGAEQSDALAYHRWREFFGCFSPFAAYDSVDAR